MIIGKQKRTSAQLPYIGQNRLVGLLFLNAPLPTKVTLGNGKTVLQPMSTQPLDQPSQQPGRSSTVAPVFDQYNQLASMQQTMIQQNAPIYSMPPANSGPAATSALLVPSAASAQSISDAQFHSMLASFQN